MGTGGDELHTCVSDGIRCDGDWWMCSENGGLFGPCEDPDCGGCCEHKGACQCACHGVDDRD